MFTSMQDVDTRVDQSTGKAPFSIKLQGVVCFSYVLKIKKDAKIVINKL